MTDVLDTMAKAHWNENPPRERGSHQPLGETGTTYVFHSYVMWDDEDMREGDREDARQKMRAALKAQAEHRFQKGQSET